MITKNQVYTKLKELLTAKKLSVYTTQFYEIVPQSFPCLYFRESHAPVGRNQTLCATDKQMRMTIYIELYGNRLDALTNGVEESMKAMNFYEDLCEMLPNSDPSIERISMRFQRVVVETDSL